MGSGKLRAGAGWVCSILVGAGLMSLVLGREATAQRGGRPTEESASALATGLAHCWFFTAGGAPADPCGGEGLAFQQGGPGSVIPAAGSTSSWAQRLVEYPMVAMAGGQYVSATPYAYEAANPEIGTWADGRAHTLVMLMQLDQFAFGTTGTPVTSMTPLTKEGEYSLEVTKAGGGTIGLALGGSGLGRSGQVVLTAAAYPQTQLVAADAAANPAGPWYLVAISSDGRGKVCLALNDSPAQECVTGVSMEEGAKPLRVGGDVYVEYVLEYSRVLSIGDRQSLYGASVSPVAPFFTPEAAGATTYTVAGPGWVSGCMRGNGWGTSYQAGGYAIPSPYTRCTWLTDAPTMTLNVEVLQNVDGANQKPDAAEIQVSLDNGEWGEKPWATLIPGSAGMNRISMGLPGDGLVHAVTVDVSGFVGFSGDDDQPLKGMRVAGGVGFCGGGVLADGGGAAGDEECLAVLCGQHRDWGGDELLRRGWVCGATAAVGDLSGRY